ncbi:hypothetical protein OS493_032947 [Desmophyllum pertusum]|uniref:G-protein coupled receptors family 1 profile domain-containing protein n=1 Tax=Desmophyllum pertusum TaxID=174260 RepID=A0A9X0CCZ8_9CNID|nr:hypothetical protein OS493_032947 [Desmophyllum pertusum]
MKPISSSGEAENGCKNTLRLFSEFPPQFFPDDFYGLLVAAAVLELVACPLTILLNALVIVAVKTKRRLQAHPNIMLACLAFSDLMVGLVVQPIHITMTIVVMQGQRFDEFCELQLTFIISFVIFCVASIFHLVLVSGERYFAIRHSFSHDTFITKARLIAASTIAWISTTALPIIFQELSHKIIAVVVLVITSLSLILWFQVAVYKVVRRHEKQILSHQVSLEARAKFEKEKKALKLTTVILIAVILCYFPSFICRIVLLFCENISPSFKAVALFLAPVPVILNSVLDPVIYTVRNRQFRVAFIELLFRKTFPEAEQFERKLFGSPESVARVEAGQEGGRRERNAERRNPINANDQENDPDVLAPGSNFDGNNIDTAKNENFALNTLNNNTARKTTKEEPQYRVDPEKLEPAET